MIPMTCSDLRKQWMRSIRNPWAGLATALCVVSVDPSAIRPADETAGPEAAEAWSLIEELNDAEGEEGLAAVAAKIEAFVARNPGRPESGSLLFELADSEESEEQIDAALGHFERLASGWPEAWEGRARLRMARIHEDNDSEERAIRELKRATKSPCPQAGGEWSPNAGARWEAWETLARIYEDHEDWKAALEAYESLTPESCCGESMEVPVSTRIDVARALGRLGRPEEALARLWPVISDQEVPRSFKLEASRLLGELAWRSDRTDAVLRKLAGLAPGLRGSCTAAARGGAAFAAGDAEGILWAYETLALEAPRANAEADRWADLSIEAGLLKSFGPGATEAIAKRILEGDRLGPWLASVTRFEGLREPLERRLLVETDPQARGAIARVLSMLGEKKEGTEEVVVH